MQTPVSASTSLVEYLASKGIRTHRAAGHEVTASCWWCNDGKPNKRKLYLNTDTWQYFCQVCTEKGGRKSLLTYFGDQDRDELRWAPGTDPALRRKVLTEAAKLAQDMLFSNPAVVDYLTKRRGLDAQTIVDAGFGYAPTSWGIGRMLCKTNERADVMAAGLLTDQGQEFFSGHILIPFYSFGEVEQLRGKLYVPGKIEGKYVTPGGDSARLYCADDLQGAKRAIITEGEFDRWAVKQALRQSGDPALQSIAVVGLSGAGSHPVGMEGYFEACTRVYSGLDPDEAGDLANDRLKVLLPGKFRELKLPRELPKCDWSDFLGEETPKNPHGGHDWRSVREIIEIADAEGRRLFTIRDAQRQLAHQQANVGAGIKTGLTGLDDHITGIKPGQIFIPLARTGAGKTSLLTTITYLVSKRAQLAGKPVPTLVASLELTAAEYYDKLRKTALFYDPLMSDDQIADLFEHVRIYDAPLRSGMLTQLCAEFSEDSGEDPALAMVDYLGYAAKNFPGGTPYERATNAVMTLKEEAKYGKFGLIAPHQAGRAAAGGVPVKLEDARDSGGIEDTADIAASLYRPGDASANPGLDQTVACEVLKNRNGRKNVLTHFVFSMASQCLAQRGTPEAHIAEDENRLIIQGMSEAEVRRIRRQAAIQRLSVQPVLTASTPV